ncbi:unnamed protein product [Ilex paraguariensis]|uniref:Uncharacterized protein n=1 Tax=Ilex paraguariensis TaxID=185542 RepID=A0ABC8T4D3_9AQUA
MGRKLFFLLVLEFFLVPSTENPIFGYKLVLVWPNTFCQNTQCNTPIPQQFTIHGLWGYDSKSNNVVNCDNGPAFDRSLLNPIEKQLKFDMPGLDRDDEIHWRHQWNKHGKCSGMSVFEYFKEIQNFCPLQS